VWSFVTDWAKIGVYRQLEHGTNRHRRFLRLPLHSHARRER